MKITVIDGQGGNIGKALITELKKLNLSADIIAIGTNSMATENMLKANPDYAATGENPVIVNCRDSDYILGPIGIVMADSMLGEITPEMAKAIGGSKAYKLLIPINKCIYVAGVMEATLTDYIKDLINHLKTNLDKLK